MDHLGNSAMVVQIDDFFFWQSEHIPSLIPLFCFLGFFSSHACTNGGSSDFGLDCSVS
jgi:hypothetical protein